MSDADTGSTTQLSRSAPGGAGRCCRSTSRRRRGRARAGTRSRPGPRGRAGAAARRPWPRAARKVTRKATPPAMTPAAPKGAKPVLPKPRGRLRRGPCPGPRTGRRRGRPPARHGRILRRIDRRAGRAHGQSLLTLALDIAQQVIRNTLAEQPESVVHAVREVLHINPSAGGQMRLWANPQDIELIRLHLADELKEGHWRVLADESLARRLPRRNALWRHRRHAADALASRGGLAGRNTSWEEPARETEATP